MKLGLRVLRAYPVAPPTRRPTDATDRHEPVRLGADAPIHSPKSSKMN
jgi:hypothetical protein